MKFRIKLHPPSYAITLEDCDDDLTILQLKTKIKKRLLSLRKSDFHLSWNGQHLLDEERKMSDYQLTPGQLLHILHENSSSISLEEPLTLDEVRDGHSYPLVMRRLVEHSHPDNDFDFLVIALHALMMESGFQMDTDNDYDLTIARKSSTFYVIRYRHKLCEEERLRCSLAIMRTDSVVTIDGVVNSISQACGKLSFHMGNYLQKQAVDSKVRFPYHNLRILSRSFKDNLANRLLCKLLEESGQQSSATLIGLPNEIKLRLAKYLPIKSITALQATCRDIHNTFNDNLLWHDLCIRDFEKAALVSIPSSLDSSMNGKNWYKLYRIMYAQRQATLRHQSKCSPLLHPTFFSLAPGPGHPTHRFLFSDTSATFHPFSPAIYRPIPSGIFRICTANNHQSPSPAQSAAQHHIYCQPFFGLKWVVFFAAATMIPVSPCFHPVWLG